MNLEPNTTRDAFIPESAPFTRDQRAWLNGFVAGLFAGLAQAGTNQPASGGATTVKASLAILYGSQTGTTEQLARKLAKEAGQRGYEPRLLEMSAFDKLDLKLEKHLLILTSTWGDGDPPDNALAFWNHLNSDQAPRLDHLEFSVLALGDRNYANFCGAGKKFDSRLELLGAKRIHPCAECDVDYEVPAQAWMAAIWSALNNHSAEQTKAINGIPIAPVIDASAKGYSKTNPFPARLLVNRKLNGANSAKETRHFEISLKDSGLSYEAGDALGVLPANCPALVEELLAALRCDGEEPVKLANGAEMSLCQALREQFQLTRVSHKLFAAIADRSQDPALAELLKPANKSELDQYLHGRDIIHLLRAQPQVRFTPADFTGLLPKLQPRLYSISSSPKAHPGEVHLTVAVVRYESYGRNCKGVCSTFLAERVNESTPVPVFIQTAHGFRLPANQAAPIIMIGPGTGIAPFRAFLEERQATGAKGKNWLFFGDQRRATDFLYDAELETMLQAGHLTRLDTAFSRDQSEKIYVQHRLLEHGPEFWSWLEAGAYVYVCGDAQRMAKDVDAALHQLLQAAGGKTPEQASAYVQKLKQEKRYQRDIY